MYSHNGQNYLHKPFAYNGIHVLGFDANSTNLSKQILNQIQKTANLNGSIPSPSSSTSPLDQHNQLVSYAENTKSTNIHGSMANKNHHQLQMIDIAKIENDNTSDNTLVNLTNNQAISQTF